MFLFPLLNAKKSQPYFRYKDSYAFLGLLIFDCTPKGQTYLLSVFLFHMFLFPLLNAKKSQPYFRYKDSYAFLGLLIFDCTPKGQTYLLSVASVAVSKHDCHPPFCVFRKVFNLLQFSILLTIIFFCIDI